MSAAAAAIKRAAAFVVDAGGEAIGDGGRMSKISDVDEASGRDADCHRDYGASRAAFGAEARASLARTC